jgi:hypothetical protein
MSHRKTLKDRFGEKIFISDNLWPARHRLFKHVRKLPEVEHTNVKDGIIHVNTKNNTYVNMVKRWSIA